MRRPLLLAVAALVLAGCVAETVERRRPRKGPVKEVGFVDPGGGQVRYSVEGWSWFVSGRRRHAKRLMRKNCGKTMIPVVVDEYDRQDADVPYSGDDITVNLDRGMDHFKILPFRHMSYECKPAGAPVEAPRASTVPARGVLVVPPRSSEPEPPALVPTPSESAVNEAPRLAPQESESFTPQAVPAVPAPPQEPKR